MASRQRLTRRWIGAVAALGLGAAAAVTVVTIASPASAATDLALGRPATADSSEAGRQPALAVDGNAATRWCAANGATGHWLQVDLGSTADVTGTQVVWEFARNYRYQIAVSTNGSTWSTVADKNANTSTAQSQSDGFTAKARYVRITVTGLAANTWASILTFSVFGTPGQPQGRPFKGLTDPRCADIARLNLSWYYNWWIYPPAGCPIQGFVPTISGSSQKDDGQVTWALDRVREAGHDTVIGFNEPNKTSQANMTVDQAIALWPALTRTPPNAKQIRVTSPSTSGDGQLWMEEFMRKAEEKKLRIDIFNIHWYGWNEGSCDNINTFKSYVEWAERLAAGRPIWITEFGCMNKSPRGNPQVVENFYAAAVAYLATKPQVERHAWYPYLDHNHVVTPDGKNLTPLGTVVANAPAYR